MLLKEFNLDLSYIKNELEIEKMIQNGLSRKDAVWKDFNDNWKWKDVNFRLENQCMMSMYSRLFRPIKTDFWKILIECVPQNEIRERTLAVGNVCEVEVAFDYETYCQLDPLKKKKKAIDLLYTGIERVCDKYEWNIFPFREVRDKIIELDYRNHWFCGKAKKSPDRKHSAQIYLEHEPEAIYIYMVVTDKEGNVEKHFLVSERPSEFAFLGLLGGIEWEGNKRVALISKEKEKVFPIEVG